MSATQTAEVIQGPWIPQNTFAMRLGMVRVAMGWNIREAARECGLSGQSWGRWEGGGRVNDLATVVQRIVDRTGVSREWLAWGEDNAETGSHPVIGWTGGQYPGLDSAEVQAA